MYDEPGWTGARLLEGLQRMADQRPCPFTAGDLVRVQVAMNGGSLWRVGRVIASYPGPFRTRVFDIVVLGTGTLLRNVKEISMREVCARIVPQA
jgi:hypothetical protein